MTETAKTRVRSGENELRVTRSRRNVAWSGLGAIVVVVVLFLFPYYIGAGTTGIMVQALIVLTLASMWNLLAGYAGLVSVGQQAFFGLGAYFVLIPAMHGVTPWLGLPIATIGAAVVIGGLGSLWGTLLGGIVLGVAQQIGAQINIGYEQLGGYVIFLLVLVVWPQGLTGRRTQS